MQENDHYLLSLIAEGDEGAFTKIYLRHGKTVFTSVKRMVKQEVTAADIVQDTFLKIWESREVLTKVENPPGWINQVAANTSTNYIKKQLALEKAMGQLNQPEHTGPEPEKFIGGMEVGELKKRLAKAIAQLPQQRKRIITLLLQGMSYQEIADNLGISKHTVKNQLVKTYDFLDKHFKKKGDHHVPVALLLPFFEIF